MQTECRICDRRILVSSADFGELCIVCGTEFKEMMVAVAELSAEIAIAYCANPEESMRENSFPGVPIEEIALRMELNRINRR